MPGLHQPVEELEEEECGEERDEAHLVRARVRDRVRVRVRVRGVR